MENRFLYRGKRIDNGEWVEGFLMDENYINTPFNDNEVGGRFDDPVEIDESTLCQCTGLRDKNGKLIYENDIVNCIEAECCGRIVWNESEAGFYFDVLLEDGTYEEERIYDYVDCMDVIGNIFDNPELLEE